MPIASKLLYFQRRPPPTPDPEPDPHPPDPRCRSLRDAPGRLRRRSSLCHRRTGQELAPEKQKDAPKLAGSAGSTKERIGGMCSSSRLSHSVSDHGRLPDAVQQARERLLQRLNSVDLSGRRQKTSTSEAIWAGVTHPADLCVSTPAESILGSLTSCLQGSISHTACEMYDSLAEPISNAENHTPTTLSSGPVSKLQESSCEGPSVECSICLERCQDADGLIQLRCKHVFHSACLEQWLRSRNDCPYCRAGVVLLTEDK